MDIWLAKHSEEPCDLSYGNLTREEHSRANNFLMTTAGAPLIIFTTFSL